ncbi:FG-GAP repeat domain-containing protein [Nannocystis pusilla]|uniref:FG-GAP repeat domain-containing protein n=1 Tax=Nannocystis pusilla TaxID=889268 RepID=UPI003DA54946
MSCARSRAGATGRRPWTGARAKGSSCSSATSTATVATTCSATIRWATNGWCSRTSLATSRARFWRSPTYWCGHHGAQLFIGDFDGDGRDDMLCHDSNGDKWVALADESGRFPVTSWSAPMVWCRHQGAQLFVGDFNGDGRDDMLCHDRAGNKWAAFADPSGQFPATSWFVPMEWCHHEGARLFVGDFNGDGRDDMLCHDRAGDKWVALADPSGQFSGEPWHSAMGWCTTEGAQLFIADFNGDQRDDMLCHEKTGDKWVALADASGQFSSDSWHSLMDWCRGEGTELHVGKFNSDERSDMLCHDPSGHIWISNARKDGSF